MRSVFVNESPSSEFHIFKGLKQGDPLSSFLFILVMESLHISFSRVMQAGDWNDFILFTIVHVFKCFFLASRLKINASKSKLMGIGVGTRVVERIVTIVGCFILTMPFTYLRVKDKILVSKQNGGLGVSSYFTLNWALLFKRVWRFISNDSSLWSRCIQVFHGIRGLLDCYMRNNYRKSLWTDIIKEVDILKRKGIDLISFCIKKVGNGVDTLFWEDVWMGDLSLKCKYLRLYASETCKHVSITMKLSSDSVGSSFHRVLRGGIESEQYEDLDENNCTKPVVEERRHTAAVEGGVDRSVVEATVVVVSGTGIDRSAKVVVAVVVDWRGRCSLTYMFDACRNKW
nr:RNA-directed DNA polymerase, eukaryota, reverse transcriptase zinc-binding domain protein [Tanacetum cinerariifolium]